MLIDQWAKLAAKQLERDYLISKQRLVAFAIQTHLQREKLEEEESFDKSNFGWNNSFKRFEEQLDDAGIGYVQLDEDT
jgi:hypothetical protein